ncbi:4470_t:CDS:2 [Racocetra fulgida]|uniref:4470_t:CDS:1 n=1 Tax=Racocetra fulgida TaxID=60492 RepID=A0A9N9AGL0_9GLOM|nr:4470_t:CDS:2 [Racocetra fulgida]
MEKENSPIPLSLTHNDNKTDPSVSSIFDTLQGETALTTDQIISNDSSTSHDSTNKQKETWFSDINSLNAIFASLGTANGLTKNPKIDDKDIRECSSNLDDDNNLENLSIDDFLETSKSASTTTPPPSLSCQPKELAKLDIIQCQFEYFGGKSSTVINSNYIGDLAFLYRIGDTIQSQGGGEISFCLNGMSDEISIPFNQLTGFKITNDGKINLRLKPNFQRKPTISTSDPTNGKLHALHSLLLAPDRSGKLSILTDIEIAIEKLWFRRHDVHNELVKDTLAYPIDSPYHRLLLDLETRFNLPASNINLRFKNNRGDMIGLKDEETWRLAKSDAYSKNLIRLTIYIW